MEINILWVNILNKFVKKILFKILKLTYLKNFNRNRCYRGQNCVKWSVFINFSQKSGWIVQGNFVTLFFSRSLDHYQDYPLQFKEVIAIAKGAKIDGYAAYLFLLHSQEYRGTAVKLNNKRAAVDWERIPAYNYFYAKKIKDKPNSKKSNPLKYKSLPLQRFLLSQFYFITLTR